MLAVEANVTREIFETSLERVLAPEVRPRRIVVMDDLSAHRGERVRDPIEARGCELVYLPHYSPDLDPIEPHPPPRLRGCVLPLARAVVGQ